MREDIARRVMSTYFKLKGVRAIPSRGAGPDFIVDGKAVEVKGTKFDLERALKQCWDYAQKYIEVAIALPVDSFNLDRLWALYNLSRIIEEMRDFPLKFYLIAESEEEKDCYFVREYKELYGLNVYDSGMYAESGFEEKRAESTIDEAIRNMLSPKRLLVRDMKNECMQTQFRAVTKLRL
jgi:hypothetical protein